MNHNWTPSLFTFLIFLVSITALQAAPVGDYDNNGLVDIRDLQILTECWLADAPCQILTNQWQDQFNGMSRNWLIQTCSPFIATASSQETASLGPANVFDGNLATRWSSVPADNQWLLIDLGQIRTVRGVQLFWETAYASRYSIDLSTDADQWTRVKTINSTDGGFDLVRFPAHSAQYVRINCTQRATEWGYSLYEVFVETNDACLSTDQWQLVWSDEFDGPGLNPDNWTCMIGTGNDDPFDYGLSGWGNNELQYYTDRPQNVDVQNGRLIITARRENYADRQFTSGRIHSAGKVDLLYGRIEASIKLPKGGGMWPAFWMMPTDTTYGEAYSSWAAHGEIDILESSNEADYVQGTLHYGGRWPQNQYTYRKYEPDNADFSQDFHTYALEWDPTEMRWYIDDLHYGTINSWWSTDGSYPAPFNQRFHILFNLAVGGNYPGCTSPSCISAPFPQQLLVDYVRVYRRSYP